MESLANILKRAQSARAGSAPPPAEVKLCPVCGGAGYLRYDVPPDDARFGELVECECTRRLLDDRRLSRLVADSNLGTMRQATFDSFVQKVRDGNPPRNSPDAALLVARKYVADPDDRPWLVLWGPFGTGKTHLAAAIVNDALAKGKPGVFIVVPDLLDHLRATFSPNSDVTYDELFETVRNTPLLVLDDLGAHSATPWAQEKLYQLINHRYNRRLPTVITSNQSPDAIEPRLRSRLGDPQVSRLVEVRDVDKRLGTTHPVSQPAPAPRRRVRTDDRV